MYLTAKQYAGKDDMEEIKISEDCEIIKLEFCKFRRRNLAGVKRQTQQASLGFFEDYLEQGRCLKEVVLDLTGSVTTDTSGDDGGMGKTMTEMRSLY